MKEKNNRDEGRRGKGREEGDEDVKKERAMGRKNNR
jgi:hypothetical protein